MTRFPNFEKATDKLDEVVLLPIPPLPYTANTFALPIFKLDPVEPEHYHRRQVVDPSCHLPVY